MTYRGTDLLTLLLYYLLGKMKRTSHSKYDLYLHQLTYFFFLRDFQPAFICIHIHNLGITIQ